jgi:exopolysaccharide biosynthesis polyprenyl glycosylphosphotransferase
LDQSGRFHILEETSFRAMLAFERRRCERSNKAYILVLVRARNCASPQNRQNLLSEIATILKASFRDADLAGWYKTGSAVGAILTDIVATEKKTSVASIRERLINALRVKLKEEQFNQLWLSMDCYPEDWQFELSRRPSNPTHYPDLASRDQAKKSAIIIKRMMDVIGSLIALLLFAPLFAVIAIAIKLTSRGPVFFRQNRVGQHGRPFVMLKFRSMRMNSDASVHRRWFQAFYSGKVEQQPTGDGNRGRTYKPPNDPRVTRVGRLLRRTSLDEAPQFINVLKGEMSLVGPRPPIPYEVDAYRAWHRGRVLQAKPGLTGLWQVCGRSRVRFDEMVRLDLKYARNWSIWLDIKILLKTPAAVISGEGAY